MSTTEIDGSAYPLFATSSHRPSGDSAIASGRSPTTRWWPAGAIFQPLGRSVTPAPIGPGCSVTGRSPKVLTDRLHMTNAAERTSFMRHTIAYEVQHRYDIRIVFTRAA